MSTPASARRDPPASPPARSARRQRRCAARSKDELRDQGDRAGMWGRERGGLHAACDEQHPVLDDIDDHRDADRQRRGHQRQHHNEQHEPFRVAVGGDATERRGDQHRGAEDEHHPAEPGVAADQLSSRPTTGHRLTHHAEDHDRSAVEQLPVGRDRHRRPGASRLSAHATTVGANRRSASAHR